VNAEDRIELALLTRDQGLADLLAARAYLGSETLSFLTTRGKSDCAHVAVCKCQQSSEKVLKGYFLFHQQNLNPFSGHNPLQRVLAKSGRDTPFLQKFRLVIRQHPGGFLKGVQWLEGMVPSPPATTNINKLSLPDLPMNTEYAFWDKKSCALTLPAVYFRPRAALQAVLVATSLCKIISASGDAIYEKGLKDFLERFPPGSLPVS